MAFPTSPTNGQQANINGITYTYSSAATAWTVSTSVSNTFVSINVSDNVNSGNVLATGVISATGNVSGGNLVVTGNIVDTGALTIVTGSNGNITLSPNGTGIVAATGAISTTGNISANNATFTSNQTLSYGTANGVIYLNSSKVATSGTALTWDGSTLAVTGTLSTTGLATLTSSQITGATFPSSGSGLELVFQSGTSKLQSFNRTGSTYLPLTIDGTTVGVLSSGATIGAFSSTGLAVTGTLSATGVATFSAGTAALPAITTTGDTNTGIFFSAADTINFSTGGADKARISSGAHGVFTVGTQSSVGGLGTDYGTIGAWGSAGGGLRIYRGTGAGTPIGTIYADAGGLFLSTSEAQPMTFSTNSTERARITSDGNLLVGTTSGSSKLVVVGTGTVATFTSTTTSQISIQAANGTGYNSRIYMECPGVNAGGLGYIRSTSRLYAWSSTEDSGPYVGANGTSWTTNSDARLKTNVHNIGYGLDAVLALLPKEYEYKIDEGKKCLGFIAQDVVSIIPELVDVPEDSSEMMGIEYQAFIPVLVKAIQEQQALITQLTARITALEGA